tara:strand:- start:1158 stop:1514 length:357 start_codon:yes stop_codon:yes gene_type:complete
VEVPAKLTFALPAPELSNKIFPFIFPTSVGENLTKMLVVDEPSIVSEFEKFRLFEDISKSPETEIVIFESKLLGLIFTVLASEFLVTIVSEKSIEEGLTTIDLLRIFSLFEAPPSLLQ